MLIMRGSYRPEGRFARPICDPASAIGPAARYRGFPADLSGAAQNGWRGQENASSHQEKRTSYCPYLSLFVVASIFVMASIQTDPTGFYSIVL
jgi:hypothetical protein